MAKQWHPFFAEVIKKSLEPKGFKVETEVEIGKLPLKIDLLVIKKEKDADVKSLPLVFQSFTDYNVLEYKSPDDRFRTDDFDRLFAYALLFKIKERIRPREQINIYAVVSGNIKRVEDYIHRLGHKLVKIKDGYCYADVGFNFYLIQLDRLELAAENYRLILFTSGEMIKEAIKRMSDDLLLEVIQTGLYLHPEEFKEVGSMPQTLADRPDLIKEIVEKVGINKFAQGIDVDSLIHTIGEKKVIQSIGEEKVIQSIGEEKVIQSIGEEKTIDDLVKMLGREKAKRLFVERLGED